MLIDEAAVGRRIQTLRRNAGLTQKELAHDLGIGISQLQKVEIGNRFFSRNMLMKVSEFFGVSMDYLLLGVENEYDLHKRLHGVLEELEDIAKNFPGDKGLGW